MDLSTNYLGLTLKNPLVAAASPMSRQLDTVRAMEDAGISAVVMYSLFEEQIRHAEEEHEHFEDFGAEAFAEAVSYVPETIDYFPRGPEEYLEHLRSVKAAVEVPVIGSLNGSTVGGWTKYAQMMQDAGADAIELNIYHLATEPKESAQSIEDRYVDILKNVKSSVSVPVALKLSPYFSSLAHFATRLDKEGVDGLVLFNRFYQPDIDLETLEVAPNIGFSAPHDMRLPLRWIAILDPILRADLAATSGIYTHLDVLKMVMAGADVTMLCAAVLRYGAPVVGKILRELEGWMDEHEYTSVKQMKGSMNHASTEQPAEFERANYMAALHTYA